MDESLWRKSWSRRPLASRENQRWTDEGAEPEEMPTWPGCGTERESGGRRHTNATMYLARWNRVAGAGDTDDQRGRTHVRGRGGERRQRQAPSGLWGRETRGAIQGDDDTAAECQIVLVQNRGIITNEFKTGASAGEDVGVEHSGCKGEEQTFPKALSTGLHLRSHSGHNSALSHAPTTPQCTIPAHLFRVASFCRSPKRDSPHVTSLSVRGVVTRPHVHTLDARRRERRQWNESWPESVVKQEQT